MKAFSIVILGLFLIGLVSANGLTIISNSTFNINKTENQDLKIKFTIKNEEPFDFQNITSKDSPLIFNKFNLLSGETKNITAKITQNQDFNGQIKIEGLYQTNIGASNITEIVTINNLNGEDKCNLNLIKGDTLILKSEDIKDLIIKNTQTQQNIVSLNQGENYSITFSEPTNLKYQGFWLGLPVTNLCEINVIDDSGLVHNTNYDAIINLNLSMNYLQTALQMNFLETSYSVSFNQVKDDLFSVKNTGSQKARYVHLSGDWINFENNDFDLNPGESKTIKFTINPIISKTNDTNKTYSKTIIATGNFPEVSQNLSIFVNYANVDDIIDSGTLDYEYWRQAFLLLCNNYQSNPIPELRSVCERSSAQNGDNSTRMADVTNQVLWDFLQAIRTSEIADKTSREDIATMISTELAEKSNIIESNLNLTKEITQLREDMNQGNQTITFGFSVLIAGILLTFALVYFYKEKQKLNARKSMGLGKGEI